MTMAISLGLVGLGAFGSAFADLFRSHPLVDRVGLCDREPERMEKFASKDSWQNGKFSRKDMYGSLDDILKSDLDALVIITQPWLHAEQAIRAMEAGKHVYSAVPIVSLPDGDEILDWCNRLVDACARTGMRYMLGETTYFRPQTMYSRRRAAAGDFGHFLHADAQYFHDVDSPSCNLRDVSKHRANSAAGREWKEFSKKYRDRNVRSGPMHYPTHSVSGPVCVMKAHAVKVCAFGYRDPDKDPFHGDGFSNETALFQMNNGATMRICEYRQIGQPEEEMFRLFGSKGAFRENQWADKHGYTPLTVEEMRDPLPEEVHTAFQGCCMKADLFGEFGGHGGSHPYLVNEFVSSVAEGRQPAINAWEAVRYMAPGVMAHKSAQRDGEVLEVPDWGDAPA
jgi:predicted dehydrogenase